jgi:hypothetical protein
LFQPTSVVIKALRGRTSRYIGQDALGPHRVGVALCVRPISSDEFLAVGGDLLGDLRAP